MKVVKYTECSICEQPVETIVYILWECSDARDVWGENTSPLRKWVVMIKDLSDLWTILVE